MCTSNGRNTIMSLCANPFRTSGILSSAGFMYTFLIHVQSLAYFMEVLLMRLCLHNDREQNMHLNIHIYANVRLLHIIKVVSNPNLLLERRNVDS